MRDEIAGHALEAMTQYYTSELVTAKNVLQGLVLQHQARRWAVAS